MPTPTWNGATAGQQALAAQINNGLTTHAITYIANSAAFASQTTDGAASIGISATPPGGGFTRLAQSFATAAFTSTGWAGIYAKKVGNGCDLTLKLFTNTGSVPNAQQGTVQVTIPVDFWTTSTSVMFLPLPITGLSASTTYWLTLFAGDVNGNNAGDASNYIAVEKSNQVTGAATWGGASWTAQAYGFMFQVSNLTTAGQPRFVWEDNGAKWTFFGYNGSAQIAQVNEYCAAQGTGQVRSLRLVTYLLGQPTTVA